MKAFVNGTDEQFENLKKELQDGLCHVFNNCVLPKCCSRQSCRMGFEYDEKVGDYTIFIDMGITSSRKRGGTALMQFRQLLLSGEIKFIDFNDVKTFFRSLRFLF